MSSIVGASESSALSRNTIISLQFQQLVAIALRVILVFNMHRLLEYLQYFLSGEFGRIACNWARVFSCVRKPVSPSKYVVRLSKCD
jgi:hypothetical protein